MLSKQRFFIGSNFEQYLYLDLKSKFVLISIAKESAFIMITNIMEKKVFGRNFLSLISKIRVSKAKTQSQLSFRKIRDENIVCQYQKYLNFNFEMYTAMITTYVTSTLLVLRRILIAGRFFYGGYSIEQGISQYSCIA